MADRTIVLAQNKRHAVRGLTVVNPQEFAAVQEQDDDLTYIIDMSSYLDGATISSVTRTPTGVTVSNTSNTTTRLTQRLKGFGFVDFKVTTSSGDIEEFRITVDPRANSSFFLPSIGSVPQNTAQLYNTVADVNGANIDSGIAWVRTAGYYAVGDGGGALYKRVFTAPSHNGYVTSNSGTTYWELEDNTVINVRQFGAKGDNTQDDTAYINYVFAYIRAKILEVTETEPNYQVYFPYGKYKTTGPINATGIRTRVWSIVGPGEIEATFNGGVVLDLTFSRFCTIRDLHISTAAGSTPDIGVLIARESNGFVSDDFHFQNLHVVGVFANACLYNYASEDFTGINCSFLNVSSSTSAYCIRLDGTNSASVTSTFQTIPANTAASFNSVVFIESDCRRANGGPCLYVARSDGFRFYACYMATTTLACVHINTTSAIFNRDLYLDIHYETSGMDSCIEFQGDATQTINGLTVIDYNPFCSDEIFKTGSGVTSVTLIAPYVRIRNTNSGVAPTNGVFNAPGAFSFKRPDISVWVANSPLFELRDNMTVAKSGVAVTHTGNTSETTLATVSLPANVMGPNGSLRITSYWTFTNSANNKTLQIRCGTTGNGLTGSIWGSTTQTTTRSMRMQNEIHNRNSTTSQVLMNGIGTGGWGTTINAASTDTADTKVARDIVFTATLANSGESITLEYYSVELLLE